MTGMIGVNVSTTYAALGPATPQLGARYMDEAGKEWIFVQDSGSGITAQYVATFNRAHSAAMLSTSNDARGDRVGVPSVALGASEYGWVQVYGPASFRVLASAVANVRLNTTGTAGALDDDGTVSSMQVQGIYLTTTNGGAAAVTAGILNYPFVDVTL